MVGKIVIAVCVAVLLVTGIAFAGEVEGTIKSIDAGERVVVLDDGTKIWLGDGVGADDLKAGDGVRVSIEERDGKSVATRIEMK
jgi:hypothetical protein